MTITYNEDKKIVDIIKKGLEKRQNHCPCRVQMTDDTLCPCKEFAQQIRDNTYEGFCHCKLYYKSLD